MIGFDKSDSSRTWRNVNVKLSAARLSKISCPLLLLLLLFVCLVSFIFARITSWCVMLSRKSRRCRVYYFVVIICSRMFGRIFCRHNCYIYCDTNCQIVNLVILYFSVSDSRRNRLIGSNSQRFMCYFIFIIIIWFCVRSRNCLYIWVRVRGWKVQVFSIFIITSLLFYYYFLIISAFYSLLLDQTGHDCIVYLLDQKSPVTFDFFHYLHFFFVLFIYFLVWSYKILYVAVYYIYALHLLPII